MAGCCLQSEPESEPGALVTDAMDLGLWACCLYEEIIGRLLASDSASRLLGSWRCNVRPKMGSRFLAPAQGTRNKHGAPQATGEERLESKTGDPNQGFIKQSSRPGCGTLLGAAIRLPP